MLIYNIKIEKFLKNLFAIFFLCAKNKVVTYKQNTNMIVPSVICSIFVRKLLEYLFTLSSLAITRIVVIGPDGNKDEMK